MSNRKWWQVSPANIAEHIIALGIVGAITAIATAVGITALFKGEGWIAAAITVWEALNYRIPVPVWTLIPMPIGLWFLKRWRDGRFLEQEGGRKREDALRLDIISLEAELAERSRLDAAAADPPQPGPDVLLEGVELDVVLALAFQDGDSLNELEIAKRTKRPRLLVQETIKNLIRKGYLEEGLSPATGYYYKLDALGRTYCIQHGHLREGAGGRGR